MTPQTEQEIEKLRTLNDNYTSLVDIFDHLVPREYVVLTLSAPSDVDWTMYSVVVINNDKGTSDTYVIPSNGVLEFEVKYDTTYTIKLPVLGDFIAPKDLTYTAGMKMREIVCSYRIVGVFGMDVNGKCYTIEQIAALEDKSIIKYGGYTDAYLENYQKADGTFGCGFMWDLNQEEITVAWASKNVEFSQELLPFLTSEEEALQYCDGEAYTQYITSEGDRLLVSTPSASECVKRSVIVNGTKYMGYLGGYGQLRKLSINRTEFNLLYTTLGIAIPVFFNNGCYLQTSCQGSAQAQVSLRYGGFNISSGYAAKNATGYIYTLVIYNLP